MTKRRPAALPPGHLHEAGHGHLRYLAIIKDLSGPAHLLLLFLGFVGFVRRPGMWDSGHWGRGAGGLGHGSCAGSGEPPHTSRTPALLPSAADGSLPLMSPIQHFRGMFQICPVS